MKRPRRPAGALQQREPGTAPAEALRLFAHWAIANQRPYVRFSEEGSDKFVATIQASEALKARARAIRCELTDMLPLALAESTGRHLPDPFASLTASLLVTTWTVALLEAHRAFQQGQGLAAANTAFLALIRPGNERSADRLGRYAVPLKPR